MQPDGRRDQGLDDGPPGDEGSPQCPWGDKEDQGVTQQGQRREGTRRCQCKEEGPQERGEGGKQGSREMDRLICFTLGFVLVPALLLMVLSSTPGLGVPLGGDRDTSFMRKVGYSMD